MPLLEVDGLVVRFGGLTALDRVSFTVEAGEFVSIIGPNGAGKTTLFNVIAGAQAPTLGDVRFAGRSIRGLGASRISHLGVARTFQVAKPFRSLSVRENVRLAAAGHRIVSPTRTFGLRRRADDATAKVEEMLALTGLDVMAERRAAELNIGELRRLEIARALAAEPRLLLLDEPAAGIGADGIRPLAQLIAATREHGVTVLLVEHHVGFALSLCDRVVVLDEGQVIADGAPDVVRRDTRVVNAYLGKTSTETDTTPANRTSRRRPNAALAQQDGRPLLEVEGIAAGYGKLEVLHGVSLRVQPGEFVTVIGANGAGKSTLLRAVMGLIPARGTVRFGDTDLLAEPPHRRAALRISYVPEGRRVLPSLTVEENLRLGLRAAPRQDVGRALRRVYDLFPRLDERRTQAARTLSGGEQQMLAMGRALVLDPVLLIADEVSLGLAPLIVQRVFDVMVEMNREGKTVLLAEQNARISLDAASRAYVLEAGRVILDGPTIELRADPRIIGAYLQEF